MEKATTQQINFVSYHYVLDDGKKLDASFDQRKLDTEWEEKLRQARNKYNPEQKDETVQNTTERILKGIK